VASDGAGAAEVLPVPEHPEPPQNTEADKEIQDTHPRWSGDGRSLAFISNRPLPDAAGFQDLAAQQVWQTQDFAISVPITRSAGDVKAFAFDPAHRQLAYIATDPLPDTVKAARDAKDDAIEVDKPQQYERLWIQALSEGLPQGLPRLVSLPGQQVFDMAFSPDGAQLAVRFSDGVTLDEYWYRSQVALFDARSGMLKSVLESRASAQSLQWSADGTRLLYGQLGPHGMTSTPVVHEPANGRSVLLASDWPGTLSRARWRDDNTLIGQGQQGVRGVFLQLDAATGAWTQIAQAQFSQHTFTVSNPGQIAYIGIQNTQPGEIWVLDNGTPRVLTKTNPQVADWTLGTVRELSWPSSRDGRTITGVLVTPPQWRAMTHLPTLVQVHGGPAWAWWSGWLGSWHDWAQVLATRGYAVFLPNPRGSTGQGAAFTELVRGDWGGGDFQDILDGVDMLEREGIIDPQRLAIGGWSYGGYMSAWAVTQSERFKTAIVGAAVTDTGVLALTTDIQSFLPNYLGDPLQRRDTYDRHSPVRFAHKVKVPVLILHGDQDIRVPLEQGQMFYHALKHNGSPVEMVIYPRATHWFSEYEHSRDIQQRVIEWLDRHLR